MAVKTARGHAEITIRIVGPYPDGWDDFLDDFYDAMGAGPLGSDGAPLGADAEWATLGEQRAAYLVWAQSERKLRKLRELVLIKTLLSEP
jgi:hypothetical protein